MPRTMSHISDSGFIIKRLTINSEPLTQTQLPFPVVFAESLNPKPLNPKPSSAELLSC